MKIINNKYKWVDKITGEPYMVTKIPSTTSTYNGVITGTTEQYMMTNTIGTVIRVNKTYIMRNFNHINHIDINENNR